MRLLRAKRKVSLEQLVEYENIQNISVDDNGNLVILSATKDRGHTLHSIFHVTASGIRKIFVPPVKEAFHHVQPLREHWLLVNARVMGNKTHNAFVYDEQQGLVTSFHLGDGIEHVQTTGQGDIWVGYFDEGVFGDTIGTSGLLCFDQKGDIVFDFDALVKINKKIPLIDDCYALNVVSNDTVYLYYFGDFPIVALRRKSEYDLWKDQLLKRPPIEGSQAFSIWEDHVLFSHGYKEKGTVHLYSFTQKSVKSYLPVNEEDEVIHYEFATGRQHLLYLVTENTVYQIDLKLCLSSF